jgi:hypothetical protein
VHGLRLGTNALGYEVWCDRQLVAVYRATEELARGESPKPCFAPIYTPAGRLITEYRPADHLWHTGLYYGWVHVNHANLWGGGWYIPEKGHYEDVPHSHGAQLHQDFARLDASDGIVTVDERLLWVDADDRPLATESRSVTMAPLTASDGYQWELTTRIAPAAGPLTLGASRAARYSGLELRLGPPFADATHQCSEGRAGHEQIMGQPARWVRAAGAAGGCVVMLDHPANPRYPVTWFTRRNLLGAGLLMGGDLHLEPGAILELRHGLLISDEVLPAAAIDAVHAAFAAI